MPLPRFENLDPAQRERILSAAQAEFAEHGYEQASLARVAARAEISKGTLYYYFSDRDDLYASVVLRLVQFVGGAELLGSFAPKCTADYWPALEALLAKGFALVRQHPEEMRALGSFQISLRRHPLPVFEPVIALMNAHMRVLVERGRELGCVRTDISIELLVELLQSADEVLDRVLFEQPHSGAALERLAAFALDTFRRLAEPRQPAVAKRKSRQKGA